MRYRKLIPILLLLSGIVICYFQWCQLKNNSQKIIKSRTQQTLQRRRIQQLPGYKKQLEKLNNIHNIYRQKLQFPHNKDQITHELITVAENMGIEVANIDILSPSRKGSVSCNPIIININITIPKIIKFTKKTTNIKNFVTLTGFIIHKDGASKLLLTICHMP